jgi:hypothetical protein
VTGGYGVRVNRLVLMVATLVTLTGLLAPSARAACTDATCDLRARIAAADSYLIGRPGVIGYVLRDRSTGLRYANAAADSMIWTASTIKLAMVVDLLTRERAGALRLSAADRQLMVAMLRNSDNDAADTLWSRYGGPDHRAFNADFPRYGMTSLAPQPGFGDIFPYWGFQKATANDLDRLMNYILGQMNSADAAAIAGEMQRVAPDQQWGVWGAGPAMSPGNKNGWSQEQGGWVINSVGFAGPDQRFTLAIMNALGGEGGYDDGVATTTRLSQILLG